MRPESATARATSAMASGSSMCSAKRRTASRTGGGSMSRVPPARATGMACGAFSSRTNGCWNQQATSVIRARPCLSSMTRSIRSKTAPAPDTVTRPRPRSTAVRLVSASGNSAAQAAS